MEDFYTEKNNSFCNKYLLLKVKVKVDLSEDFIELDWDKLLKIKYITEKKIVGKMCSTYYFIDIFPTLD